MRIALALLAALAAFAGTARATAAPACSAARLGTTVPAQKLPRAVAAKRDAIVGAAVACDYAELQRLTGRGFRASFGNERSAAGFWRSEERAGRKPLATLVRILRLPYVRNETGSYAWPSAYRERPTRADWDALVRGGVLTRAAADRQRTAGNVYYGYRTAITPRGVWQFFLSGD